MIQEQGKKTARQKASGYQKKARHQKKEMLGSVLQQLDSMSPNCFQRMSFLLLLALTAPVLRPDWQGTGNMTQDNMTEIETAINANPFTLSDSGEDIDSAGEAISTKLNTLWAPAWNVIIVMADAGFDSIVYGYAFRGHWLWINGAPLPGSENIKLAYIIWKDYNCQTWQKVYTLSPTSSTFSSDQLQFLNNYGYSGVITDIWGLAHPFVESLRTSHNLFNTGAYTAVFSQSGFASFYGYICLVNYNYLTKAPLENSADGAMFLFQTR